MLFSQLRSHPRLGARSVVEQAGYAAIDALVALIVLTLAIVASLSAVAQGRHLSQAAFETNEARAFANHLLSTVASSASPGDYRGANNLFEWMVTVSEPVRTYAAGSLCTRTAHLVGKATHRGYTASTASICPEVEAPGSPGVD